MLPVALIIALATGITCILDETGIQSILIDCISDVSQLNPTLLILIMFLILVVVSAFIPSLSALTNAVYPTLGPSLATQASTVSISGSILCTSFANGIIHLLFPTSTTLIYGLNECKMSFKEYYQKI